MHLKFLTFKVIAWMLFVSLLFVGQVSQPNGLGLSNGSCWYSWWTSGTELVMTTPNALQLGNLVSRADLTCGHYTCLPNLKNIISSWNVLSEILYFIIKSSIFLVFYKKANFFQKNKLFSVYSSFYPLKEFWIIQCFACLSFVWNNAGTLSVLKEAAT